MNILQKLGNVDITWISRKKFGGIYVAAKRSEVML